MLRNLVYGSLPVNVLLSTGLSFIFGGFYWRIQTFAIRPLHTMSSCLLLGVFGLSIVKVSRVFGNIPLGDLSTLIHGVAAIFFGSYLGYLVYRFKTHPDLFMDSESRSSESQGEEVEDHMPPRFRSKLTALCGVLLCMSALVVNAKLATNQIPACIQTTGISRFAIAFVIFPVAVNNPFSLLATQRQSLDAYLVIMLDRTLQLVLLCVPILWLRIRLADEHVDLEVEMFAVVSLFLSVFVHTRVVLKGKAYWFTGLMMVIIYLTIGIGAFLV